MDNDDAADDGDDVVGEALALAVEEGEVMEVDRIIRQHDFLVLQQFDPETGEVDENDDGSFNVVLVEVDEESAVVAFTKEELASEFLHDVEEELPHAESYPSILLDGNTLLDGLPEDCGLLINPGALTECYLPPGFAHTDDQPE